MTSFENGIIGIMFILTIILNVAINIQFGVEAFQSIFMASISFDFIVILLLILNHHHHTHTWQCKESQRTIDDFFKNMYQFILPGTEDIQFRNLLEGHTIATKAEEALLKEAFPEKQGDGLPHIKCPKCWMHYIQCRHQHTDEAI